jgi:DNA-binding NarL/FixJ family response regulator
MNPMSPLSVCVRILLVEDFVPFRRFIGSILQRRPEWRVVYEVSDGLEAVQKAEELKPDLILLDIGLPNLNGLEVAKQVGEVAPGTKILYVSVLDDAEIVRAAFGTGAMGYVLKGNAASELLPAIEAVLQGRKFVGSGLADWVEPDSN